MNSSFNSGFADLHLLKHPFYQAWMAGTLSQDELKDYAQQYFFHVDRFPRYLSAIHSNCENAAWRADLLQNLMDEEGAQGATSHPELWLQFSEGLGVSRSETLTAEPRAAIKNVAATFFKHAKASFHEGLGALYAYESQVPEIAHSKIEGLKQHYNIQDAKTLAFFDVHEKADVAHREVVLNMLENLPAQEKEQALVAAKQAARALWDFLTDVHGTACA